MGGCKRRPVGSVRSVSKRCQHAWRCSTLEDCIRRDAQACMSCSVGGGGQPSTPCPGQRVKCRMCVHTVEVVLAYTVVLPLSDFCPVLLVGWRCLFCFFCFFCFALLLLGYFVLSNMSQTCSSGAGLDMLLAHTNHTSRTNSVCHARLKLAAPRRRQSHQRQLQPPPPPPPPPPPRNGCGKRCSNSNAKSVECCFILPPRLPWAGGGGRRGGSSVGGDGWSVGRSVGHIIVRGRGEIILTYR